MSKSKFNIFQVLAKDDKELIHSEMVKFLLLENNLFWDFLKSKLPPQESLDFVRDKFGEIETEKSYSVEVSDSNNNKKYRKRMRVDVQSIGAISEASDSILLIENKFKSFPYLEQVNNYNDLCNENFKHHFKFLLCFDSSLVTFEHDWNVLGYKDLVGFLESNSEKYNNDYQQLVMIDHYIEFLKEYLEGYSVALENCKSVFTNMNLGKNKFWMKLIFSALHLKLYAYFKEKGVKVKFVVNPGSTSTPLINIIPEEWKLDGNELLIQFQGSDLKLYSHSQDKEFGKLWIGKAKLFNKFEEGNFKFKKFTKRKPNSYYICKCDIKDRLSGDNFKLRDLYEEIICFYKEIDLFIKVGS